MHNRKLRRRPSRGFVLGAGLAALLAGVSGMSPAGAAATRSDARISASSLAGKRVLVVPYWLDTFGSAFGNWVQRDYKALGVSVTVFNANAVASAQLNVLDTAIASGQYAGIIWQPIDVGAATTTIQAIQGAKIPQVVFNADLKPGQGGVTAPQLVINYNSLYASGQDAARYLKSHPKLGTHPELAWIGAFPTTTDCNDRLAAIVSGMKSISPGTTVVLNTGASSAANAESEMADFITRGKSFNVFDGCGSTQSVSGVSALQAAGLAGATNKVPAHVYIMSQDATPPELQLLWSSKSAMMLSDLLPPRGAATAAVDLLNKQLTGKIGIKSPEIDGFDFTAIGTNCRTNRPIIAENYLGVAGITTPSCPAS